MKTLWVSFLLAMMAIGNLAAQDRLLTKSGKIHFYSKAPLEDIEAENTSVTAAIDLKSGQVVVKMFIKDFRFEKALMQEHFNENYLESDQFPTALFTGTVADPTPLMSNEESVVQIAGDLTIHGVKRPLNTSITLLRSADSLQVDVGFEVALKDHNIKVPNIVVKNIAEVVQVSGEFQFSLTSS